MDQMQLFSNPTLKVAGTDCMNTTQINEPVGNRVYLFYHDDLFYLIELEDDADAIANAEINKGTTKVEDINGRVVWQSTIIPSEQGENK